MSSEQPYNVNLVPPGILPSSKRAKIADHLKSALLYHEDGIWKSRRVDPDEPQIMSLPILCSDDPFEKVLQLLGPAPETRYLEWEDGFASRYSRSVMTSYHKKQPLCLDFISTKEPDASQWENWTRVFVIQII